MNNQQEKTLLPSAVRVQLKKLSHHLKPVVQIGKKGVTDGTIREIEVALMAHELIKVQLSKETSESDLALILEKTGSSHIDTIGKIVILFKKRKVETSDLNE